MPTQTQEIAALGHYWLLESRYMVLWQCPLPGREATPIAASRYQLMP